MNILTFLLRSFLMFFVALFFIRIIGNGNLSKMTSYKFVTYMFIALIAALTSANVISNLIFGIIALAVWSLLALALDYLCIKSKAMHDLFIGKETILIKDGKILEDNLSKIRATGKDLLGELRSKNAFSLADVEFAVMEATGELNVLLKSDKKPLTAHDLQRKIAPASQPQAVILDGEIMDDALGAANLSREWLNTELDKIGVISENIFIGQVDSLGTLYLDLYDDNIQVPQNNLKELLYANIQKSKADLTSFTLDTNDEKAKAMYSRNAEKLKKMLDKLEPYLLR
ncbi:DUF421 domain-containing protein [Clostridium sp. WILCCON 0202]|uniref:DUF421 domain-containing protein n=2 Tax=Candidatus Clostridium radicumherbarum TaxID=3381662 RepID=A0ABW8TVS9_9CLOT